jgi:hypothetical protein
VAEYETLVNGLHIAADLGVQWLYICGGFKLVVNKVMGELNYRDSHMAVYLQEEVRKLKEKFDGL